MPAFKKNSSQVHGRTAALLHFLPLSSLASCTAFPTKSLEIHARSWVQMPGALLKILMLTTGVGRTWRFKAARPPTAPRTLTYFASLSESIIDSFDTAAYGVQG